jgi:hypothetical protein
MKGNRKILTWEIAGFFFIVVFGSLLHFTYEWSHFSKIVAYFSAVNESTWEHLKLAFFPALIFAIVEYTFTKNESENFLFAKTISFYIMPITIIILFYGYLSIFKSDSLFWDILIFILAVLFGQIASYKILVSKSLPKIYHKLALGLFIVIFLSFSLFTYFPPKVFLVKDPITGGYGFVK